MRPMPKNSHNHSNRPGNGVHSPHEHRDSYGQKENGVPVPGVGGFRNGMMAGAPVFDLARSPPGASNKNTRHVPCKFFRQGACQAGNACPFSHSLDPLTHQAPCKYFSKGNCKFGAKCALAHYLPDGRRVNRGDIDNSMMPSRGYNYSRADSMQYPNPEMSMDPRTPQQYPNDYFAGPFFDADEQEPFPSDRYGRPYQAGDSALNSPPTSQFGSPPNDSLFPKSPINQARTALNVPMPQSFDPSEPLHLAPFGRTGTSAPTVGPPAFSPPGAASSLSRRLASPPDSGSYRVTNTGTNLKTSSPLGASPQNQDDSIDRIMQSTLRQPKPRGISASVPRPGVHPQLGDDMGAETDLLPGSLHDEILTPAEQIRRLSRADQEGAPGMAIPSSHSSKVGSPPSASAGSPSRFSHIWAEQREKRTTEPPGLAHVGSPLRESWMPTDSASATRGPQVSGISQAMQRMQLSRTESNESASGKQQLSGLRHTSNPLSRIDRTISSPGLPPRKIDEDGEGVFFPMDDDKRSSSIWSAASPRLAPLREKPNGEISRTKKDDLGPGASGMSSLYGFRP